MSIQEGAKKVNPGPLGLLGFGMTTVLLNLHNAGIIELSVVIVAMGFALGGLAQVIAGILEFVNKNTFAGTAFTAYGFFWWSLIFIWINPTNGTVLAADAISMGYYLALWCVFTVFMFIASTRHNKATQMVFFTLSLLFGGLAISDFTADPLVKTVSGVIGIICGATAIYTAMAQVVNGEFGRVIFPLGDKK